MIPFKRKHRALSSSTTLSSQTPAFSIDFDQLIRNQQSAYPYSQSHSQLEQQQASTKKKITTKTHHRLKSRHRHVQSIDTLFKSYIFFVFKKKKKKNVLFYFFFFFFF